jgi:hypothetical protein
MSKSRKRRIKRKDRVWERRRETWKCPSGYLDHHPGVM